MLDENNTMFVIDDEGNERAMEIILTFTDENTGKNYVILFHSRR